MPGRDGGTQRRRVPDSRHQKAAKPLDPAARRRNEGRRNPHGPSRQDGYRGNDPRRYNATSYPPKPNGRVTDGRSRTEGRGAQRSRAQGATGNPRRSNGSFKPKPAPAPSATQGAGAGASKAASSAAAAAGSALSSIGRAYSSLWRRSKPVAIGLVAILVVAVFSLFSLLSPHDRIADGIRVGEVDVSGMTVDEAAAAIGDKYTQHLNATTVYIFADEETANSADVELQMIQNEALAEQLSFEEAQSNKKLWIASAESLQASVPSKDLAQEALDLGNRLGMLGRLGASEEDLAIAPRAAYDESMLSGLVSDINMALGSPVEDYSLSIDGEDVSVVEGRDGSRLDDGEFKGRLDEALLVDESALQKFVADVHPATYRIDQGAAELAKSAIQEAVPGSVEFVSEEKTVSFDRPTLMSWVATRTSQHEGAWYLEPYIDEVKASKDILEAVNVHSLGEDVNVSIDFGDNGSIWVNTSKDVAVPNIEGALDTLDGDLFDSYRGSLQPSSSSIDGSIGITTDEGKSAFTLDEALSYGLVTEFSSFTTQFTNTSSTANRRDNIHLVSDAIGDTVAKADGGKWSFLDHAGPMEEEDGYKDAGVIVGGKFEQGVGGGVCQVATTVFNAVYQGGLDIDERHNHTLYSSSYPAGLDAAVSYPGLDLIWSNQTSSDILLRTSYTDSSVTVTLVGIDPELEVETVTGEWQDGKKHTTEYEADENLKAGASYVKTAPSDGTKINVTRYVKDKDGKVLDWDAFSSIYSPVNRVIVYGEGSDLSEIKSKYIEEDDE